MQACYRIFDASLFTSWDMMCKEVAEFVNALRPEQVISISHSDNHGHSVAIVWYWRS
ncbi:MAG: hypothetical protein HJJLKODD_00748 [Phycisphaerae bacterium]|nr:hypothetical protein [Phycisphaerae bacterium]